MNTRTTLFTSTAPRAWNRRDWMKASGLAAATLTAGGCRRAVAAEPIRVGILHSQTGTMAISEVSLRDAELFAVEEINRSGGVLGRPLEPIVEDPRSDMNNLFARKARKLLAEDRVPVVFGCWTSSSRKSIVPVFEELDRLLFYPLQYEGNESSPNVIYTGSTPNQQLLPAIDWLRSAAGGGKRRFFLIGSDYVFPRTGAYVIRKHLEATVPEATIVGTLYRPLGDSDFKSAVTAIKAASPDVIINLVNGESNVAFFRELGRQRLRAETLPVLSSSVGEDELRSFLPSEVAGHLAVWSYFQSLRTPRNQSFVQSYKEEHGFERVVDDPMMAAYCSVYLWKRAVEIAGSTDTAAVREALKEGVEFDGPAGRMRIDPKTQHVFKRCRIGRIRPDLQFDMVYESSRAIPPDPYPPDAFPGWGCDWTKSGLVRGEPVEI
jgi:urea transport system substrate-binding protein